MTKYLLLLSFSILMLSNEKDLKAQETSKIIFQNVKVFDGQSGKLSEAVNVLIEENKNSRNKTERISGYQRNFSIKWNR